MAANHQRQNQRDDFIEKEWHPRREHGQYHRSSSSQKRAHGRYKRQHDNRHATSAPSPYNSGNKETWQTVVGPTSGGGKRRAAAQTQAANHHGSRKSAQPHGDTSALSSSSPPSVPFMLMLVGIPGSGKSTFATLLEQSTRKTESSLPSSTESAATATPPATAARYVRINQDTLGTRKKCEEATRQVLASSMATEGVCCPIIDRCNFNVSQRRHFLNIAKQFQVPVDCIALELNKEMCVRRCQQRQNHETICRGQERQVVESLYRQYQSPHRREGFRRVERVTTVERVNEVIAEYRNVAAMNVDTVLEEE